MQNKIQNAGMKITDPCLLATIFLVAVSIAYWSLFNMSAYNNLYGGLDLGIMAFDMNYYLHYLSPAYSIFQPIVIGSHMSPDFLIFMLPLYAVFPEPITLGIALAAMISLWGMAVFFITRDLLGSSRLALVFCFAYLISPAAIGMMNVAYPNAYPIETFVFPFYILTFYYYIKMDRVLFFLSLALLLGAMESAPALTGALAAGLILYEAIYTADKATRAARIRMGIEIMACAIIALIFYNIAYYSLASAHAAENTMLQISSFPLVPIIQYGNATVYHYAHSIASSVDYVLEYQGAALSYSISAVFLGFGIGEIMAPLSIAAFSAPWLVNAVAGGNFSIPRYIYLAFGGSFCASMLGAMLLLRAKRLSAPKARNKTILLFAYSALLASLVLLMLSGPFMAYEYPEYDNTTVVYGTMHNLFFMHSTAQQQSAYSRLYSIMALVPNNAPLMTMEAEMDHMPNRQFLEVANLTQVYFAPEFVLEDFNSTLPYSYSYNLSQPYLQSYTSNGYYLYARDGDAVLYKRDA